MNDVKLLIMADDFTGAMDTGVQFAKLGAFTNVVVDVSDDLEKLIEDYDVLVIDAETRHSSAEEACEIVRKLVRQAASFADIIYKKTDSALRGNIGAELEGLLEGSGGKVIHFAPAYPVLGRVTRSGVQYVNGVPVHESVFGRDPFKPTRFSGVSDVIGSQSDVRVQIIGEDDPVPAHVESPCVLVYDASTDARLADIAGQLQQDEGPLLLAGCAGFAAHLRNFLSCEAAHPPKCISSGSGLLVVSGSMNPITCEQIAVARRAGFRYVSVNNETLLSGFAQSGEMERLTDTILENYRVGGRVVVEVSGEGREFGQHAEHDPQYMIDGRAIANEMGKLVSHLIGKGFDGIVLVTGGDTLMGVMRAMNVRETHPIFEIEAGVVYTTVQANGKTHGFITKSGGFGTRNVFLNIMEFLRGQVESDSAHAPTVGKLK